MKLKEKEREKGRVHRRYDTPQTPFQRLIGSDQIINKAKNELKALYDRLNPAELKRSIDKKLTALSDVYSVKNQTQNAPQYKKIRPITRPNSVRFNLAQREPVRLGV
jgi:hypothetical protein